MITSKMKNENDKLPVMTSLMFHQSPARYELRKGDTPGASLCPFGNHFEWIGYELEANAYVRFTKSVFKILIKTV